MGHFGPSLDTTLLAEGRTSTHHLSICTFYSHVRGFPRCILDVFLVPQVESKNPRLITTLPSTHIKLTDTTTLKVSVRISMMFFQYQSMTLPLVKWNWGGYQLITHERLSAVVSKVICVLSIHIQCISFLQEPSTFIPDLPDTSPLARPPDIPKRFLIEESDFCQRQSGLQIIAYVHSSIQHVRPRNEIRRTWGNASAYDLGDISVKVGVVFMVGRAKDEKEKQIVQEESQRYHDIVQVTNQRIL